MRGATDFRARLRAYTHAAHGRLEHHPRMRAYARGELSGPDHSELLSSLLTFWQQSAPRSRSLPEKYHRFVAEYRAALRDDGAAAPSGTATRNSYDEIAFFYLLLGSSHGARYMLRQSPDHSRPRQHLRLLAGPGKVLWNCFVDESLTPLNPVRQGQVMGSARRMFHCLHDVIDTGSRP